MSNHTPGPWHVTAGHKSIRPSFNSPAENGGFAICEMYADGRDFTANARLIAAAPELLEACQTFAEWLRREDEGFPAETRFKTPEGEAKWREWYDENIRVCALAMDQARAAIAKAAGEA